MIAVYLDKNFNTHQKQFDGVLKLEEDSFLTSFLHEGVPVYPTKKHEEITFLECLSFHDRYSLPLLKLKDLTQYRVVDFRNTTFKYINCCEVVEDPFGINSLPIQEDVQVDGVEPVQQDAPIQQVSNSNEHIEIILSFPASQSYGGNEAHPISIYNHEFYYYHGDKRIYIPVTSYEDITTGDYATFRYLVDNSKLPNLPEPFEFKQDQIVIEVNNPGAYFVRFEASRNFDLTQLSDPPILTYALKESEFIITSS